jgi:hypothetical protein
VKTIQLRHIDGARCHFFDTAIVTQCRDRFVNKIDPNLKKTEWTEEEDKLVVAAQSR